MNWKCSYDTSPPHPPKTRLRGGTFLHEQLRKPGLTSTHGACRGRCHGACQFLKEHLFPLGWRVTDNAFVHYREGKAIHHVDASACAYVCACTVRTWADCMQVAWLSSRLQCGCGRGGRGGGGGAGGAGGLAGRCNAGKASGDKDSHWCQAGAGYLFGWGSWE